MIPAARVRSRRLLEDAGYAARFLAALPRVLRRPLTPDEARRALHRMLAERESDFLILARRVIYRHPNHPLRRLLALAGCEYGDLAALVGQEGLEGALRELFRRGVYLTIDEFKRGRPVVRGSTRFTIQHSELLNPFNRRHLPIASGGSRGAPAPAHADLWQERVYAVARCLYFEAIDATAPRFATWDVPGSVPIQNLLLYASAGARPTRWFTQVDPSAPGLDPRYRWSGRLLRWGSLLAGAPMPFPEPVPLSDPGPIVRWLAQSLRAGETPVFRVSPSAAVRVCEAALADGVDLTGARFMLGSEPVTPARLAAIERTGASAVSVYGSMDAGFIGEPCAAPEVGDEMHLRDDLLGTIQPGADAAETGLSPETLLFTTLRPRAVYLLLNVSLGDQAELYPARCGCALMRIGLSRQLRNVRSFEKLNAGGATLLDVDAVRVLEEVLPARFGGGPLDYQLLESVDGDGRAALRLLVHPRVGPLDPSAVVDAFMAALAGDGAERVRELLWREGEMLQVERAEPRLTPAGKVLHLHQERQPR